MEFSNNSFAIPYNCATSEGNNIWANYSSGSGPPPPPQVIIVQAPKLRRSFDGYASRAAQTLGVGQVSLGVLSILLGIANPLTCGLYGMVGFGIWSGVIFVIAGTFGIVSSRKRTSGLIISHMVMSIIAAVAASVQFSLGVISAYFDFMIPGCYYYSVPNQDRIDYNGSVAVDALLATVSIVEGVVAILASAVSCKVICCSSQYAASPVTSGNGQFLSNQVVFYGAGSKLPNSFANQHERTLDNPRFGYSMFSDDATASPAVTSASLSAHSGSNMDHF